MGHPSVTGQPGAGEPVPVVGAEPVPVVGAEPGPPRSRRSGFGMVLVAVPVFVAVTLGVVMILSDDSGSGERPSRSAAAPADRGVAPEFVDPANSRLVSAPVQDRQEAIFDLITGTTVVRLGVSDLGDQLYRISTPARASVLPRPEIQRDRVLLHLVPSGENGPGAVDIELNSRVRWQLRLTGGAAEQSLDLGGARLAGVELLGGATRVELTLPQPEGTLTVRMTGGVNQFLVHAPAGPPARVRVANGAGAVTLDGNRRSGIARGTVLTPDGWDGADERFDFDLVAGVGTVTVQRR